MDRGSVLVFTARYHAGYSILVGTINEPTIGIDTPEDYRAFVERARPASARGASASVT